MRKIVAFAFGLGIATMPGALAQNGPGGPPPPQPDRQRQIARLGEANGALLQLQIRTSEMLQLTLQPGEDAALDQGFERLRLELQWTEEQHARLRESFGNGPGAELEARLREMDAIRARLLVQLQGSECDLCDPALEQLRLEVRLTEEQHLRLCEGLGGSGDPETTERLREVHALRAQTRLQLREMECQLCPAGLDRLRLAERLREMEQLEQRLAERYRALGQQLGLGPG